MYKVEMPVYDPVQNKDIVYLLVANSGISWIEDTNGIVVFPKIRKLKVLSIIEVNGNHTRYLIGSRGDLWRFYTPPTLAEKNFVPLGDSFHEVTYHSELGGIFLAKTGACSKILDRHCSTVGRSQHHRYFMNNGKLCAQTGAAICTIDSPPKHVVLDCWLTREYKSL